MSWNFNSYCKAKIRWLLIHISYFTSYNEPSVLSTVLVTYLLYFYCPLPDFCFTFLCRFFRYVTHQNFYIQCRTVIDWFTGLSSYQAAALYRNVTFGFVDRRSFFCVESPVPRPVWETCIQRIGFNRICAADTRCWCSYKHISTDASFTDSYLTYTLANHPFTFESKCTSFTRRPCVLRIRYNVPW